MRYILCICDASRVKPEFENEVRFYNRKADAKKDMAIIIRERLDRQEWFLRAMFEQFDMDADRWIDAPADKREKAKARLLTKIMAQEFCKYKDEEDNILIYITDTELVGSVIFNNKD